MDCKKERSQAVTWSNLPSELVMKISDYQESSIDKLHLRCVCSSWRAALLHHTNHHPFVHVIPDNKKDFFLADSDSTNTDMFLIKRTIFLASSLHSSNYLNPFIFKTEKIHPNDKFRSLNPFFMSPINDRLKYFPKEMNLLDIRITQLQDEYVLCYKRKDYDPVSKGYNYYGEKVVHLSLGNGDNYAVLTIKRPTNELAMFRSVDSQWQIIDYMGWKFRDVISFNGMFYAVEDHGNIVTVRVSGDVVPFAAKLEVVKNRAKYNMVQLGNELILVSRVPKDNSEFCYYFDVYKLDRNDCKWVKMSSLGDRVLFLGEGSAFWASSSDLSGFDNMGSIICHMVDSVGCMKESCKYIGSCRLRTYYMETEINEYLDTYDCYLKLFCPVPSQITDSTT